MSDGAYIEFYPLSAVREAENNPKDHDIGAICTAIREFGFVSPLLMNETTGRLLAGHGRIEALRSMQAAGDELPKRLREISGEWCVPVVRGIAFDSDDEADAYLLADNKLTMVGGWNDAPLAEMLQELAATDAALFAATGFDEDELDKLLHDLTEKGASDQDDPGAAIDSEDALAALVEKWQVNPGDIFLFQSKTQPGLVHKLLCGDSTDKSAVLALFDGKAARWMWTDPPYGVNYVGKTSDALEIENDAAEGLEALLNSAFGVADAVLEDGAPFYIAHPAGKLSLTFGLSVLAQGWLFHETLVWVKNTMVMGHADYHYQHEPLIYGWKGKNRHWYGGRTQKSTIEVDKPTASKLHPTMKPPELIEKCLSNSSRVGDLGYEPFCGSGSTLVAAERMGRCVYAVEISEKYCAATLERLYLMGLQVSRA